MARKKLPDNPDDTKMSLGEHLEELRVRIIRALLGLVVALGITLWYGDNILNALEAPVVEVMQEFNIKGSIVSGTPHQPFMLWMRASMLAAFVLASPWIFYQMWMFIAAGLYPNERKYVNWGVPFSALLFCAGALFFLGFIAKQIMRFFLGFGQSYMPHVMPMLNVKEYISLMTTLMVVFGLAFQMPIVVFILGKMGLVTVKQLNKYRRYVIVIILIVAAFATSPSPVDQVGLAIPMWLLYELGILLVHFFCKPKPEEEAGFGEEGDGAPGTALATTGAGAASYDDGTTETDYDEGYGENYEDYYNDSEYDDEDYGEEDYGEEDYAGEDYAGEDYEDQDYGTEWDESGFADDEQATTDEASADDESDDIFEEDSGYSWSPPSMPEADEEAPADDEFDDEPDEDETDGDAADNEPGGDEPDDDEAGDEPDDNEPDGDEPGDDAEPDGDEKQNDES